LTIFSNLPGAKKSLFAFDRDAPRIVKSMLLKVKVLNQIKTASNESSI